MLRPLFTEQFYNYRATTKSDVNRCQLTLKMLGGSPMIIKSMITNKRGVFIKRPIFLYLWRIYGISVLHMLHSESILGA